MAYQAIPPASTGAVTPDAVALNRAKQLLGPTIDFVGGSSFDNDQWYRADVTNLGTVTYSVTSRGGVLDMATTATANRSAIVFPHGATTVLIDNPRTSKWMARARFKWTTAVDSAAICTLLLTTATLTAPFLRFGVRGSLSSTFISWSMTDNAGVDQATGVTTAAFDTTAYHMLDVANDGTTISFYYDLAAVGSTAATNFGTSPVTPAAFVLNGATATNRGMSVDELYFCCVKPT